MINALPSSSLLCYYFDTSYIIPLIPVWYFLLDLLYSGSMSAKKAYCGKDLFLFGGRVWPLLFLFCTLPSCVCICEPSRCPGKIPDAGDWGGTATLPATQQNMTHKSLHSKMPFFSLLYCKLSCCKQPCFFEFIWSLQSLKNYWRKTPG